jgi:hypothetical protein
MKSMRFPLLALAGLLGLTLACSTVSDLFSGDEPGTLPGMAPPGDTTPGAGADTPVLPEPTSDVQRLERRPTATPFYVTNEEDPRAILDLPNPTHNDFFDDPNTWYRYDDDGYAAYEVDDGQLEATDYSGRDRPIYWSYTSFSSGNVYAEISATFGECYSRDVVGFVIRVQPEQTPSGYGLEVSCDGAWRFRRLRPAQVPFEMVDWTSSDLIQTGEGGENRLGIWGYRGQFYLFINGTQVGEARDSSYTYELGYFAAYVQSQEAEPLRATFDDFAYWNIPYQP